MTVPVLIRRACQGAAALHFAYTVTLAYPMVLRDGKSVPQDKGGSPLAQAKLAVCYTKGHGLPQDFPKAAKYFALAADRGHEGAQVSLGVCYAKGQGVPQDYVQAVKYYRRAAKQGDAGAKTEAERLSAECLGYHRCGCGCRAIAKKMLKTLCCGARA